MFEKTLSTAFTRLPNLKLAHARCNTRDFSTTLLPAELRKHLTFYPNFFSGTEQRVLLEAALHKLDGMESGNHRRKRKALLRGTTPRSFPTASNPLQDLFLPDNYYEFQQGHYDGVIKNYREMHVSSWPDVFPALPPALERLHSLMPSQDTQTHILHLASDGEIQPHVDNISASGSWILGCSLGAERVLRLENDHGDIFSVPLPSGSVYIQRDDLRFNFKHSILLGEGGQRLSIMIRDRLPK
ncbi:2OG-FeII-Oxy-2 domain-containing protein [Mycena indigotica]|uniref:2OG-FeII-Oxy-2 domain-containing protein n=1 Tax=Mycena indigotica TaxID=2126181 RepID=A0A8H6SAT0_9AGAR|nr:2OG-FeII-Oxy-2 domain-containing protein [Mycena indigotica]KAF7295335.1 2OG-FeII-Oxy-2 domain-containing protein [Mycena indigotica]